MRLKLFAITFLLPLISCFGQEPNTTSSGQFDKQNSIQTEAFGHGLLYSINYERIVLNRDKLKTTGQVGIAYYPPSSGVIELWIPVLINELISFNKHHMEISAGYIFTNEPETNTLQGSGKEWSGFITARIGYRYQKPNGRFIFRIAFTPIIEYTGYKELHPSGGLSFGYAF